MNALKLTFPNIQTNEKKNTNVIKLTKPKSRQLHKLHP